MIQAIHDNPLDSSRNPRLFMGFLIIREIMIISGIVIMYGIMIHDYFNNLVVFGIHGIIGITGITADD